jgi:MFS family permease
VSQSPVVTRRGGTASSQPANPSVTPTYDRAYRQRLLGTVMLAVMGFGSLMTIVTVSLTIIAEDLGTSRTTLGWIVTGLMLSMAVFTPLGGKLGDIRGHRRIFLVGLAGSIITTVLCALAWNALSLIVFRVAFGMFGALVQPNGMALMMAAYGRERRATAMGWFQFATTGAPTIGLVVGGPLISQIGWRGIFWIFAGVSVVAFGLAYKVLQESPLGERIPLDVAGSLSLASTILFALLAVSRAVRSGLTDPLVGGLTALAVVSLVTFIRVERHAAYPLLQLRYFRRPTFTAPMMANSFNQFAYMGGFVVTPILLGDDAIYGYGLAAVAWLLATRPGAFAISSPLGGIIATRFGEVRPMVAGSLMMVAVIGGLVLSGASAGIGAPAFTTMVAGSVEPKDIGVATGMAQTMLFVGIVSGIQIMLVVLGEQPDQGRYALTFLFGAGIALLGLTCSLVATWSALRGRSVASAAA